MGTDHQSVQLLLLLLLLKSIMFRVALSH